MFFRIDPSGDLPIYEQIVRQVKFAVATGGVVPGQLVPFGARTGQAGGHQSEHGDPCLSHPAG